MNNGQSASGDGVSAKDVGVLATPKEQQGCVCIDGAGAENNDLCPAIGAVESGEPSSRARGSEGGTVAGGERQGSRVEGVVDGEEEEGGVRRKGRLVVYLHHGYYHTRLDDLHKKHGVASLVFAPNSGLAAYPSWVETVVSSIIIVCDCFALLYFECLSGVARQWTVTSS
jgi:hypothetical protein